MNKMQLVAAIAAKMGATKTEAAKFLSAFAEVVSHSLQQGDKVMMIGFGSFSTVKVAERNVRNPQTGVNIKVPVHMRVKFSVGKQLKEEVNHCKK